MKRFYSLLLLLIPLILVGIWFKDGKMLAGAEEGLIFYRPEKTIQLVRYPWVELGTGRLGVISVPYLSLFYPVNVITKLGVQVYLIQAGVFYLVIVGAGLGIFFLTRFLNDQQSPASAFWAAAFYLFNPFTVFSIWQRFLIPLIFLLPLVPISLVFFWKGLVTKKLYWIGLFVLTSIIFSSAYVISTAVIVVWSSVTILGGYYMWLNKNNRAEIYKSIGIYFGTLVGWVAGNYWWLNNLISSGTTTFSEYTQGGTNLSVLLGVSQNLGLKYVPRLISKTHLFNERLWGDVYSSWGFQIISWIIPVMILLTLFRLRTRNEIKLIILIIGLALFVTNGVNWPLGGLFKWFFEHIFILQPFRNPFEKYGIVLALGCSLGFGWGITLIKRKVWKYVLIIAVLGIYVYPMWTGTVFGGNKINYRVEVPSYYAQADRFLQNRDRDSRIIELPFFTGGGVKTTWEYNYQGSYLSKYIFSSEVISEKSDTPIYNKLLKYVWRSLYAGDFWKSMHLLGSRFLVLHHDIDNKFLGIDSATNVKSKLISIYKPSLIKINDFNPCPKWETIRQIDNITIRCRVSEDNRDWSQFKFIHIQTKSSGNGKISYSVSNSSGQRAIWDEVEDATNVLSLEAIKSENPTFNFNKIEYFYIRLDTYPTNQTGQANIEMTDLWWDMGIEVKTKNITEISRIGKLVIYELNNQYVLPKIFIPKQLSYIRSVEQMFKVLDDSFTPMTDNSFTFDQELADPIDKEVKISYQKINPALYKLYITKASQPFVLVFNDSYHPLWRLTDTGGDIGSKHFIVNGFANGFWITKPGNYQLELKLTL